MCVNSSHIVYNSSGLVGNAVLRRDPTQTTVLRNRFAQEMSRRFTVIRGLIRKAIVDEDVFGLKNLATFQHTPGRRAFAFDRSSQKVSAFMEWLEQQVRNEVLDITDISQVGESINAAWTNKYVNDSYRRGVQRARIQLRQGGLNIPTIAETGGIALSLSAPVHLDRLGLLYTRTFNELKGITDTMDSIISRTLTQGIADGLNPVTIARQLNAAIIKNGETLDLIRRDGQFIPAERRSKILARTEIVRAHAEGQLQEFANWGVEGVGVEAEWVTAGDNRVCPICEGLQGQTFSIEDARGRLPAHPQCRCAWIPKVTNELRKI